ncbi:MAG: hypothetical protein CM1200mP10_18710 [Candidatus Neomarinimicrobiota bacterium]|nr:MAG: hypothetical protein CM1200mP10_18710 [Candidatus Neomarinimicrobiota bacterium]
MIKKVNNFEKNVFMANNLGKNLKNMTNIHTNMYGMLFAFNK